MQFQPCKKKNEKRKKKNKKNPANGFGYVGSPSRLFPSSWLKVIKKVWEQEKGEEEKEKEEEEEEEKEENRRR